VAFRLVLQSPRGARGMVRQYKGARDAALRAVAEYWCRELLPGHFTAAGGVKYRYAPRTERHNRRKRREGRGEDPNVYTGRLKQKMLGMKPRVSVNKRGLVLVWSGLPKYTYVIDTLEFVQKDRRWDDGFIEWLKGKGDMKAVDGIMKWRRAHPETRGGKFVKVSRPNKVAELTAMNGEDAQVLGRVFRTVFQQGIDK
jgi:hypothetical protein